MSKKLIVGNWKMNGLKADSGERVNALVHGIKAGGNFDMVLCPPATLIAMMGWSAKDSAIRFGGQDCHAEASGAFTGNISAQMLKDLGCTHVILGHSERRAQMHETNAIVQAKAKAAHAAGLVAIICVGETDEERTAGKADAVVLDQLKNSVPDSATDQNTVIAYEPVWAIGTGKVASNEDVKAMHATIRAKAGSKALLYGGSVKGSNAKEILHIANVDGVLVGGASLKADDFLAIALAS